MITDQSSLNMWLNYIENNKTINLNLDTVLSVADSIGLFNKKRKYFVFLIGGTNGKGSTCKILEQILIASGYFVGCYTSPHLLRYTERITIQSKELTETKHVKTFAKIDKARKKIQLTYFEYSTISAFMLFDEYAVDVAIIEVGLGGRLDATNIINPNISIITSIGIDHTNLLGNDRESIGREKAGIFRKGIPAIIGDDNIPLSVKEVASNLGINLYKKNIDWHFFEKENSWQWKNNCIDLKNLPLPSIPIENAATALAGLYYSKLNFNIEAIHIGIKKTKLKGRFQIVNKSPFLILDVAHNPHAASYLANKLKNFLKKQKIQKKRRIHAITSMLVDKDISGTLDCLKLLVTDWYCAPSEGYRAASIYQMTQSLSNYIEFDNIKTAWIHVMNNAHKEDIVIIFGSFYAISNILIEIEYKNSNSLIK